MSDISKNNIPKHIAIIMDGNGRWAKSQGIKRIFGHKKGVNAVRSAVEACVEVGVEYLTLYAFSTENWDRPKVEVDGLMTLLVDTVKSEIGLLQNNGIKLRTIGDITALPKNTRNSLEEAMELTGNNKRMDLVLALNYSGRWDIIQATNKAIASGNIVDEHSFEKNLSTYTIPDPELLIRTSGEERISNFLLWQTAYTEFYFSDVLWPDFTKDHLFKAVIDYQGRERRFGKISEQLTKK